VTNFGGDLTFICGPLAPTLCEPCRDAADCGPLSVDLCLDINGDRRCARDCSDGRPCPDFYECITLGEGSEAPGARQCLPVDGRCGCTAAEVGTTRPCSIENAFGRCRGQEFCDPERGWVDCTAQTPRPEECDGVDNDCDERVDEELDGEPCELRNAFGVCVGATRCQGISGMVCDGPEASLEVCDGLDNDCNDEVDDGLCFDGNPCTRDVCDAETGCSYPPFAGPCDDQTVCTLNDHCVDGTCTGAPLNCDDNNPCTDDRCDPVAGCINTNNAAPCDTGNPCTSDVCDGGVCRVGPRVQCNDGSPCTDDSCDPARGCVFTPADGRLCDDDDPCTTQSVCGGGQCVGTDHFCTSECGCLLYTCAPIGSMPFCICLCP